MTPLACCSHALRGFTRSTLSIEKRRPSPVLKIDIPVVPLPYEFAPAAVNPKRSQTPKIVNLPVESQHLGEETRVLGQESEIRAKRGGPGEPMAESSPALKF